MSKGEQNVVSKIIEAIETLKLAKDDLDQIRLDAQEKHDNLSEKAQAGEQGEKLIGQIEKLDEAIAAVDDIDTASLDALADELGELE